MTPEPWDMPGYDAQVIIIEFILSFFYIKLQLQAVFIQQSPVYQGLEGFQNAKFPVGPGEAALEIDRVSSPVVLDLGFIILTFGLTIQITIASVIGYIVPQNTRTVHKNHRIYFEFFLHKATASGGFYPAGYAVIPDGTEDRHDIIQAVTFGSPEAVIAYCQGIQVPAM